MADLTKTDIVRIVGYVLAACFAFWAVCVRFGGTTLEAVGMGIAWLLIVLGRPK